MKRKMIIINRFRPNIKAIQIIYQLTLFLISHRKEVFILTLKLILELKLDILL